MHVWAVLGQHAQSHDVRVRLCMVCAVLAMGAQALNVNACPSVLMLHMQAHVLSVCRISLLYML
eukprot:1156478-Pelagomonas_calceolata.AAC.4